MAVEIRKSVTSLDFNKVFYIYFSLIFQFVRILFILHLCNCYMPLLLNVHKKIKTKTTISPQDQPDVLYIQMQHSLFGFDKYLSIIQYSFGEFMFLVLIFTCLPNIGILCAASLLLVHCYWSWRLYGPV